MASVQSMFSQDTVNRFVDGLHTISGMHIGLHDIHRDRGQASAGDDVLNLCALCRNRCAEFLEACHQCDSRHIVLVQKTKQTQIYTCHLGLTEVLIPITDGEEVTGVLFLGMARIANQPQTQFSALAEHLEQTYPKAFPTEERETLRAAYNATAVVSQQQLSALIDLAEIAVRGMYLDRWIRGQKFSTEERFKRYLEDIDLVHLPLSELSVSEIARQLQISYSQLNRLSASVTGLSFKQYVLYLKLETAADQLLANPTKKISDIAASVGFDDICYFSRLFAQKMGMSCMEYRKTNQ